MFLLVWIPFINTNSQDSIPVNVPTGNLITADSIKADTTTSLVVKKHSPTKAALLSAVLPGSGQIYNRKLWKVPIVYAGIGVSAFYFVRNQRWYKNYLEGYVNYSNTHDPSIVQQYDKIRVVRPGNEEAAFAYYVDLYRRWRDWSVVILAGTYLLNVIDATVDAYMFDYDISENLALRVEPAVFRTVASSNAFGIRLSFNLH